MSRVVPVTLLVAALIAAAPACLPTDTRTPPGSLYTSVTGSDMTEHGIKATDDGWSISFERVLVGIGVLNLGDVGGASCNRYSNRGYMRLLELRVPGPQKLSIAYALGQCDVSFRLRYPGNDSVLGADVTGADRTFMDTPDPSDPYADVGRSGIAVYVQGTARRGAAVEHFAWAFRRRINYRNCGNDATDAGPRGFSFHSHNAFKADIAIHAEALFQDRRDPATAKLHFQPYADADTNHDGVVTLDELGAVPASKAGIKDLASSGLGGIGVLGGAEAGVGGLGGLGGPPDAAPGGFEGGVAIEGGMVPSPTLEDYVYLRLVPAMVQYRGVAGSCSVDGVPPIGK